MAASSLPITRKPRPGCPSPWRQRRLLRGIPSDRRRSCPSIPGPECACGDRRSGGPRRSASPQGRRCCGQRAVRDPLRRAVHLLECVVHRVRCATSAAKAGQRLPRQPETNFRARSPATRPAPARTMPWLRGRDRSRARGIVAPRRSAASPGPKLPFWPVLAEIRDFLARSPPARFPPCGTWV